MSNEPLWKLGAFKTASLIKKREISAVEAVSSSIERVKSKNQKLNAVVDDLSEEALNEAKQLDEIAQKGELKGPLHGVPITIKENIDQEGHTTPNGLVALKNLIAPGNAPVVDNLKNAGAVIIGRTNTPEFSMRGTTDNVLHGRTFNPWNDWASPG